MKGEFDPIAEDPVFKMKAEIDRLRAENARLASDIEGLMKEFKACHEAIGLSMASSEPLSCFLQRHREALEKARGALDKVWEVEEMGYTPDDPESESGVCTCNKCEGVQHHNSRSHAENCPQSIIEDELRHIDEVLK